MHIAQISICTYITYLLLSLDFHIRVLGLRFTEEVAPSLRDFTLFKRRYLCLSKYSEE